MTSQRSYWHGVFRFRKRVAVKYILQGLAPHLDWLQQRLSAQGLPVTRDRQPLPAWLPADWQGIWLGDSWLDLDTDASPGLSAREQSCERHGAPLLELAGEWQAEGSRHGFILYYGGPKPPAPAAQALLDALSPLPGCWLPCGPPGSGRFCLQAFAGLRHACQQALPLGAAPSGIDWQAGLARQLDLADKLGQLAENYLTQHAPDYLQGPKPEHWRLPPGQQAHFAANLAACLHLAASGRQDWRQLLQRLAAHAPSAA
ncbi:hypothetical protein CEK28_11360 [Xenophilus sp. AP218F]|nr:hypothetical protein CEK28_11360 [Xenophilus sp. AP218F]